MCHRGRETEGFIWDMQMQLTVINNSRAADKFFSSLWWRIESLAYFPKYKAAAYSLFPNVLKATCLNESWPRLARNKTAKIISFFSWLLLFEYYELFLSLSEWQFIFRENITKEIMRNKQGGSDDFSIIPDLFKTLRNWYTSEDLIISTFLLMWKLLNVESQISKRLKIDT